MKTETEITPKWYETLTFKMALLGFMAIMFIVPLQLIMMVIRERESSSQNVRMEIAEQWGKRQIISGPVLNIPVNIRPGNNEANFEPVMKIWHIMPEELSVAGRVDPEIRYKGIYETVIYDAAILLEGRFEIPTMGYPGNYEILWKDAYLTLGISDNRGLKDRISVNFNDQSINAEPGLEDHDIFESGISFPSSIDPETGTWLFSTDIGIRGSSGIFFSPVGKSTRVNLSSEWVAPSFQGNFLPQTRNVDDTGFSAEWIITNLNRNFPQEWIGSGYSPDKESFGAELILEVDHYQKSERSVKYGMLFIAFTFLVLLYIELSSDKRIHIFNYFLVSIALVLFFSLLNSLSEHIGFNPAYLISSVATISLITLFTRSLLKERKPIIIVSGMLTVLYIFIFILLVLNQFSYLAGNIGLFVALAAIMRLSTKTDLFRKSQI